MTVIDALDAGACYDGVVAFVGKYGVITGDPQNFPGEKWINEFVNYGGCNGDGFGYGGYGEGDGNGDGFGYGGYGEGDGNGDGFGYGGYGYSYRYGYGGYGYRYGYDGYGDSGYGQI